MSRPLPDPNPYLACNYECPECGVHAGHDSDCSWAKQEPDGSAAAALGVGEETT
jgi:hypothetical protein